MRWTAVILVMALGCSREAPPAPSLTIADDARPMLDGWAAALGGRERLARISYHRRAKTRELWISATGLVREVSTRDGVQEVRVFDGTRGWLVDGDGETRQLAPRELDLVRLEAFLYGGAALFPDRSQGSITRISDDAIELALATRKIQIWFDPKTHLPSGYAERGIERSVAPAFGDWRELDGVKLAYALQSQDGSVVAPFDLVDHAAAPADAFATPTGHPRDVRLVRPLPISIPLTISANRLGYVAVDVNGTSQMLLVDSGANSTSIDRTVVEQLGLASFGKTTSEGSEGKIVGGYVRGLTFTVGGVAFSPAVANALSLKELARGFAGGLDGMLGYSFLSRFVVELDYRAMTMTLHDPEQYRHAGTASAIPITLEKDVPRVEATVTIDGEAITGQFILDTGCGCVMAATEPFLAAHPGLRHASALVIGAATIPYPRLAATGNVVGAPGPALARTDFDGLLGAELGERFRIVLDYRHQRIWLDPY